MLLITPENFPHGITCGCDCSCTRQLTDGNAMTEMLEESERDWNGKQLTPSVGLMICAECYVGNHVAGLGERQ
jgi:hypothetical protein